MSQQTLPAIKEAKQKKVGIAKQGINSPEAPLIHAVIPLHEQRSRFSVQVNGQVFIGFDSVTLNRRILDLLQKVVNVA